MELLELGFESREQREGIRGRPGETCKYLVVVQAADLFCPVLDNGFAESDLAVAGDRNLVILADTNNGRRVNWKIHSIISRPAVRKDYQRDPNCILRFPRESPAS
jgi:hypothetical protein